MTPAEYVDEIVLPTVREFAEDRQSHRRAYLACLACLRITNHLRQAGEEDVEARIRFAAGSAFDVVRDVCDLRDDLRQDLRDDLREPSHAGRAAAHGWSPGPGLMDGATARFETQDCASSRRRDLLACLRELLLAYRTEYGAVLGRFDLGVVPRRATRSGPGRPVHGDRAPGL